MTESFTARVLTTDVSVTLDAPHLAPSVRALLASFDPPAGEPRHVFTLEGTTLLRDGVVIHACDEAIDLVAMLELSLYEVALTITDHLVLHAAAVTLGETALVLAGPSGAGKTTLSHALVLDGAGYLSDEYTALDATGEVTGLRRGLNLTTAFEAPPPGFAIGSYPLRMADGRRETARFLHPPRSQLVTRTAGAKVFVCLTHDPASPQALERLRPSDAVVALWRHAVNPSPALLTLATEVAGRSPVFALRTRRVDEACDALWACCQSPSG